MAFLIEWLIAWGIVRNIDEHRNRPKKPWTEDDSARVAVSLGGLMLLALGMILVPIFVRAFQ